MAIDPRISLAANVPNVVQTLTQLGQNISQGGIRQQLLEQHAQVGQAQIAQQQGVLMNKLFQGLGNVPMQDRAAVVAQQLPMLEQMGIDPSQVLTQDLSDSGIQRGFQATLPFTQQVEDTTKFQFGASEIIRDDEGNLLSVTQRRDPKTGDVETVTSPIEGTLVSGLGETAEEITGRKVEEAELIGDVEAEQRLSLAQELSEIEKAQKRQEGLSSNQIDRLDKAIEAGLSAASALPDINRGLELLKEVDTGGITARSKSVTDFFGTTSGDVAELNNILAQNVLAGLSAFTGAISEGERNFLEQMETNLSQGTAFNIAQLNRMRNIYNREVEKAKKAATLAGDDFALDILNSSSQGEAQGFTAQTQAEQQAIIDFVDNL